MLENKVYIYADIVGKIVGKISPQEESMFKKHCRAEGGLLA